VRPLRVVHVVALMVFDCVWRALAQLLTSLEATVRDLQRVTDVAERKPWRSDGHKFIGKMARRFFAAYGISDGRSNEQPCTNNPAPNTPSPTSAAVRGHARFCHAIQSADACT
jgi:hypothetical protein